jgi:hypothetical protein
MKKESLIILFALFCLYNFYLLFFSLWYLPGYIEKHPEIFEFFSNTLLFQFIIIPIFLSLSYIILVITGIIAIFNRSWWWVFAVSLLTIAEPLILINNDIGFVSSHVVIHETSILISLAVIVLTIIFRKDLRKPAS